MRSLSPSAAELTTREAAHDHATKRLNHACSGCHKLDAADGSRRGALLHSAAMETAEREATLISLTEAAAAKIKELQAEEPEGEVTMLRVAVQGGGCSGFEYALGFDNAPQAGDHELVLHGVQIVVDPFSAPYLQGANMTPRTVFRSPVSRSTTRTSAPRAAVGIRSRWRTRPRSDRRLRLGLQPLARSPFIIASMVTTIRSKVTDNGVVDITILGAGPTGLAAAYYAGHRDAIPVRIVESLEQIGGQVAAVYPEARRLRRGRASEDPGAGPRRPLRRARAPVRSGRPGSARRCRRSSASRRTARRCSRSGTTGGNTFLSRSLIVTAGHGAFEPRKLEVEGIDEWEGRGLHYFVRQKEVFRDSACVIVGGGDSALDWTLGLQDTAKLPIALVHRRDRFRALESSVNEARELERQGNVRIMTPCEVREVHGDGSIRGRRRSRTRPPVSVERVDCDALITLLGFHSHLGAIVDWGLELEGKRQISVEPMTMETNLPRVFAAGDVAGYPGKITLITVGMAEAAIAANNAIAQIRGEKVQPKYSTD